MIYSCIRRTNRWYETAYCKIIVATSLFIFLPTLLLAQIQLIPTTNVLDRAGVGTVMVINTVDEPREISIQTEFRYNVANELGLSVDAGDYSELEMYDISNNLLIYPPRFILGGGERRDVRVQHRMRGAMPDGGYFSRFMVRAEPMARDAIQEENADAIAVQLNYVYVQDIPLYHFYGTATTGISINSFEVVEPDQNPEQYLFLFDMEKSGNSPYRGSVEIVIRDTDGEIVEERTRQVGLFTSRKVGIPMDRSSLQSGVEYDVQFTFRTRRSNSAPNELVQAPNVTWNSRFSISEATL